MKREWFEQREQSAGRWRLLLMWFAYKWLGKGVVKALCIPVVAFIYPFARPAKEALREYYTVLSGRKASSWTLYRHLLGFAWSLADKTDACTLKKNLPRMSVREDNGWRAFRDCATAGRGCFAISSHVGTVEVLPALPLAIPGLPPIPRVHAFQQMTHDAAFTEMFTRHFDSSAITLHAVEDVGVETAIEMKEAIGKGEMVLMAGDRVSAGSAKTLRSRFLGVDCAWPKGVFAFARLMEAPVFFVTCVRTGWNEYEAHFAEAHGELLRSYMEFLEGEVRAHPGEWHHFHRFFR